MIYIYIILLAAIGMTMVWKMFRKTNLFGFSMMLIISEVLVYITFLNIDQELFILDAYWGLFFMVLITSVLIYLLHLSNKSHASKLMQINELLKLMVEGDLTRNKIEPFSTKDNQVKSLVDNLQMIYNQLKHQKGAIRISVNKIIDTSNNLKMSMSDQIIENQLKNMLDGGVDYIRGESGKNNNTSDNEICMSTIPVVSMVEILQEELTTLNNVASYYRLH